MKKKEQRLAAEEKIIEEGNFPAENPVLILSLNFK